MKVLAVPPSDSALPTAATRWQDHRWPLIRGLLEEEADTVIWVFIMPVESYQRTKCEGIRFLIRDSNYDGSGEKWSHRPLQILLLPLSLLLLFLLLLSHSPYYHHYLNKSNTGMRDTCCSSLSVFRWLRSWTGSSTSLVCSRMLDDDSGRWCIVAAVVVIQGKILFKVVVTLSFDELVVVKVTTLLPLLAFVALLLLNWKSFVNRCCWSIGERVACKGIFEFPVAIEISVCCFFKSSEILKIQRILFKNHSIWGRRAKTEYMELGPLMNGAVTVDNPLQKWQASDTWRVSLQVKGEGGVLEGSQRTG